MFQLKRQIAENHQVMREGNPVHCQRYVANDVHATCTCVCDTCIDYSIYRQTNLEYIAS